MVPEFVQRGWKTVATFNAQVRSILAFPEPVAGQESGCSESPATLRAVVRLQPTVDSLVFDEDRVVLEAFVTLGAFVHPRLLLLLPARGCRHIGPFGQVREVR